MLFIRCNPFFNLFQGHNYIPHRHPFLRKSAEQSKLNSNIGESKSFWLQVEEASCTAHLEQRRRTCLKNPLPNAPFSSEHRICGSLSGEHFKEHDPEAEKISFA
jgi:hypothetical protein